MQAAPFDSCVDTVQNALKRMDNQAQVLTSAKLLGKSGPVKHYVFLIEVIEQMLNEHQADICVTTPEIVLSQQESCGLLLVASKG